MSGTGKNSKPWTEAIAVLLADGQPHTLESVLTEGAKFVDAERATHEMRNRTGKHDEARMIEIGKRNVAHQAISGMVRFGKAEWVDGKKSLQAVASEYKSPAALATRVGVLEEKLEQALLSIEALEAFRDHVESQQGNAPAERLFEAASTSAVSSQ